MPSETAEETIARLESLLSAGATSVRAGDISTEIDLGEVRRQLLALRRTQTDTRMRRPVLASVKLTNL